MKDLSRYTALRAYLVRQAMRDSRVGSVHWGEDKRMLEAQHAGARYPYIWFRYVTSVMSIKNGQHYRIWKIETHIKGNVVEDSVEYQDRWLDHCHEIMWDMLGRLLFDAEHNLTLFDMERMQAVPRFWAETDNLWGWQFDIEFATKTCEYDASSANEVVEVTTLKPVYAGSAGDLALEVNGEIGLKRWDAPSEAPYSPASTKAYWDSRSQTLHSIAEQLSNVVGASCSTDGSYLYIRQTPGAAALTINQELASNDHSWQSI